MSLPAADKSVWEIKMKGGGVPLRSAGCLVSVAVYRGKQCQPADPALLERAFPEDVSTKQESFKLQSSPERKERMLRRWWGLKPHRMDAGGNHRKAQDGHLCLSAA